MKVEVLINCNLPAGSVIQDVTELKNHYKGTHSSRAATFTVKVLKSKCSNLMEDDELTGWARIFKEKEDKLKLM